MCLYSLRLPRVHAIACLQQLYHCVSFLAGGKLVASDDKRHGGVPVDTVTIK